MSLVLLYSNLHYQLLTIVKHQLYLNCLSNVKVITLTDQTIQHVALTCQNFYSSNLNMKLIFDRPTKPNPIKMFTAKLPDKYD